MGEGRSAGLKPFGIGRSNSPSIFKLSVCLIGVRLSPTLSGVI